VRRPGHRRRAARLGPAVAALLALGCADLADTELGVDATVESASVRHGGGEVSATLDVSYRVGTHAEGERRFGPQSIDLFVGESLVATLPPTTPPGFDGTLAPGESARVTLEGVTSDATDPARLCGAEVTVLFRWVDATTLEIGMTEAVTSDVTCE
jgi:hypothetical protein